MLNRNTRTVVGDEKTFDVLSELFPYEFHDGLDFHQDDAAEIARWCQSIWGESALRFPIDGKQPHVKSIIDLDSAYVKFFGSYFFKNMADAAAFRLAWSGK